MKISHIALYVNDLEGIKDFYQKYFGAESNSLYHNPKNGLKTYFLSFGDGSQLEIMTRPNILMRDKSVTDSGYIHFAFSVGSKEKVDELTLLLKNDGFSVISGPRVTGDGHYESCVLDPENNQIEIVA